MRLCLNVFARECNDRSNLKYLDCHPATRDLQVMRRAGYALLFIRNDKWGLRHSLCGAAAELLEPADKRKEIKEEAKHSADLYK